MRCVILYVGSDGSSRVGHHGIDLKDPARYSTALAKNGHRAQIVDLDTGEIYGDETARCPICDVQHPPPYNGSCLL